MKAALADPGIRDEMTLSTGNSINLARFLPQAVYYVHAWASLDPSPERLLVSVPCGNLGNLAAGLLAKRVGLPAHRFVGATNANDVFVRFLESGEVDAEPSRPTLSSAMDVTRPSNLERLLHLCGGDLERLRREVTGSAHDDAETLDAMRALHRRFGYLADPHTAVGWLGLEALREGYPGAPGVVLSTADPAKFPDAVEKATGARPPPREGWAKVDPESADVTRIEPEEEAFREIVLRPPS